MLRTFFLLTLLSSLLFSASDFTVKLATYRNSDHLEKLINRFSPALKKTVRTYKRGKLTYAYTIPTKDKKTKLTYAYTIPTKDKKTLKKLLPAYRKVFSDAYITPVNNKMK